MHTSYHPPRIYREAPSNLRIITGVGQEGVQVGVSAECHLVSNPAGSPDEIHAQYRLVGGWMTAQIEANNGVGDASLVAELVSQMNGTQAVIARSTPVVVPANALGFFFFDYVSSPSHLGDVAFLRLRATPVDQVNGTVNLLGSLQTCVAAGEPLVGH